MAASGRPMLWRPPPASPVVPADSPPPRINVGPPLFSVKEAVQYIRAICDIDDGPIRECDVYFTEYARGLNNDPEPHKSILFLQLRGPVRTRFLHLHKQKLIDYERDYPKDRMDVYLRPPTDPGRIQMHNEEEALWPEHSIRVPRTPRIPSDQQPITEKNKENLNRLRHRELMRRFAEENNAPINNLHLPAQVVLPPATAAALGAISMTGRGARPLGELLTVADSQSNIELRNTAVRRWDGGIQFDRQQRIQDALRMPTAREMTDEFMRIGRAALFPTPTIENTLPRPANNSRDHIPTPVFEQMLMEEGIRARAEETMNARNLLDTGAYPRDQPRGPMVYRRPTPVGGPARPPPAAHGGRRREPTQQHGPSTPTTPDNLTPQVFIDPDTYAGGLLGDEEWRRQRSVAIAQEDARIIAENAAGGRPAAAHRPTPRRRSRVPVRQPTKPGRQKFASRRVPTPGNRSSSADRRSHTTRREPMTPRQDATSPARTPGTPRSPVTPRQAATPLTPGTPAMPEPAQTVQSWVSIEPPRIASSIAHSLAIPLSPTASPARQPHLPSGSLPR